MRTMPAIGIGTLAGMLGITGAPFFNGSISKYFISDGLQGDWGGIAMFLINLGTTLSFRQILRHPLRQTRRRSRPPARSLGRIRCDCLRAWPASLGGLLAAGRAVALRANPEDRGAYSIQKLIGFAITLGVAVLAYFLLVSRIGSLLTRVRTNKFTFNQLTIMLTLFFMTLTAFLWISSSASM
jgi:multicomponent Na+:H+ antiporter subunit D